MDLRKIIKLTSFPPKEVLKPLRTESPGLRLSRYPYRDGPAFSSLKVTFRENGSQDLPPNLFGVPLTVAGTAPDFHRIPPFLRAQPSLSIYLKIKNFKAKVNMLPTVRKVFKELNIIRVLAAERGAGILKT